jgi:hypothetical protein
MPPVIHQANAVTLQPAMLFAARSGAATVAGNAVPARGNGIAVAKGV